MHKAYVDDSDRESISHGKRRVLLKDPTQDVLDKHGASSVNSSVHSIPAAVKEKMNGRLQGVYEHVSCSAPQVFNVHKLISTTVSPHSPCPFPPYPFHITVPPCSRHPPISLHQSHRRQQPRPCRPPSSSRRRPRRNSQNPLAHARRCRRRRRRPTALDPLHASLWPHRSCRSLDDCPRRRGRLCYRRHRTAF